MKPSGRLNREKGHLPRLAPEYYRGSAFVFWTHTMEGLKGSWLSDRTHALFRETALHAGARFGVLCPVYCLMPDHAHLLWLGVKETSDQQQATRFLRKHLAPTLMPGRFQKQPHDHVLREKERERNAFQRICYYIQENPVRNSLVADGADYPYTGCIVPGYPELDIRSEDYWDRFWRVYVYLRGQDEAG